MSKHDDYVTALRALDDPDDYLLEHSGLPGPRGNLELIQAAADVGSPAQLRRWADLDSEFLAACGVVGLGRLLTEGDAAALEELRLHANDSRWRVREAVAMALQRWGVHDFEALADAMAGWARGSLLERRAAAAALCEPVLLSDDRRVETTLDVLAEATEGIAAAGDRRSDDFRALRKGLGYCWSVAVAAAPAVGRPAFEGLVARAKTDRDLRWIARENLRKRRLERVDAAWVARLQKRL